MKRSIIILSLTTLIMLVLGSMSYAETSVAKMTISKPEHDLGVAMRKLWEDHVIYTSKYIVSTLMDLNDTGAIAQRLLANQDEIGNAIIPYYGKEAGTKLAGLLREHIMVATEVVKAAKAGKEADLSKAQANWTTNANDIAVFLSSANPNWNKKELADMLNMHLSLNTNQVVSYLKKDWNAYIAAYDEGKLHMLMMADVLSAGIVKQFPKMF